MLLITHGFRDCRLWLHLALCCEDAVAVDAVAGDGDGDDVVVVVAPRQSGCYLQKLHSKTAGANVWTVESVGVVMIAIPVRLGVRHHQSLQDL